MGPTGVGTSSVSVNFRIKDDILIGDKFINIAAGKWLEVNRSLSPCTSEFAYVRCMSESEDSREVVLVDTPAFPDPFDNDTSASAIKKVGSKMNRWVKEG